MSLTSQKIFVESPPPGASLLERGKRDVEQNGTVEGDFKTRQGNNGQQRKSATASIGEPEPIVVIREEFESGMLEAMACLLKAHKYATELDVNVWDFAVEIDFLRQRGISANDLRWLVGSGWLEQAEELTASGDDRRTFNPGGHFTFETQTCFVLTERGVFIARALSDRPHCQASTSETHADSEDGRRRETHERPQWFEDRQQLYLGDGLVKEFKLPSPNQITILTVFEEEQWPPHIDDPLPTCQSVGPKERLRYTIKSLNKHQKKRKIRFRGDGRGEGVCWELWEPDKDLERN